MWPHLAGAMSVLVPGFLALQAWRFLRLAAPTPRQRLQGLPRCTAVELARLPSGTRAVVEGRVRPARPGGPLPGLSVRRRERQRGARTLETRRETPSTPPLELLTAEGTVRLLNGDYVLGFPSKAEDSSSGDAASLALREGDVACAVVSLEEKGRAPRARAEALYAGPLASWRREVPVDVRLLRGAVAAMSCAAALGAGVWGWWGLR
jgi:hypothetical protein